MRHELAETGDEGLGMPGCILIGIGGGNVHIDVEPPGEMVGDLDVELGVGATGNGGDDRGYLGGFKVEGGNDTHQRETAWRLAGNEEVGPGTDAGFIEVAGHPA